jgi:8-oxo-dGTP pyrophosphatase MutT (NUDIX family)
VLLGHRHPQRHWYPNVWDLIGGHIEPGETGADAIRRECREELAIAIHQPRPLQIPFETWDAVLHGFLVTEWDGDLINAAPDEHDALAWFTADQLGGLRLADHAYAEWLPSVIEQATHIV